MDISPAGLKLISEFEGKRLKAYRDPVGIWTIGYGHTGGVRPGQRISEAEALKLLRDDVAWADRAVTLMGCKLSQPQFDALVSLVFNCGPGIIAPNTTIGRALRAGRWRTAANAFLLYTHAGGKVLPGLVRRRKAERDLFRAGGYHGPYRVGMGGRAVGDIQRALVRHGGFLSVDGSFGRATGRAVATFKAKHGLPNDAVVGRRTWDALGLR